MDVLFLGAPELEGLLPIADCVAPVREALADLASGSATAPLRGRLAPARAAGTLLTMPAFLERGGVLGVKVLAVVPAPSGGSGTYNGGLLLRFDGATGHMQCIMDAGAITKIRTAATSVAATEALARADSRVATVLGGGQQAEAHAVGMATLNGVSEIRLWDRSSERARQLESHLSARLPSRLRLSVWPSVVDALDGCDILCTTTRAQTPIVRGHDLPTGIHGNAVGAASPGARELDAEAFAVSQLFADRRESLEQEADEFRLAIQEGAITPDHVLGEIGEVFAGRVPGRLGPTDRTRFKSVGVAVEDLAAARTAFLRAQEQGLGTLLRSDAME
ncbi:MAG: ornithine cyclodeaminase family protein [Thermoplasmata archaeon]